MKRVTLFAALLLFVLQLQAHAQTLRFAFITDTHYGKPANNKDMLTCIEDINSLKDSLAFVLVGGDLTNFGSDKQIIEAKKLLDKLALPFWAVSGNHDSNWSESGCNTFTRIIGYDQFEFEAGGYRFIGCNSGPDMRKGPALVPRNSLNWIKSLEPGKPLIFLNHYPLDNGLGNWYEVRKELIRLDCRLAIAGHHHKNQKRDYNGIPGIVGRCTYGGKGRPGYNIITIQDGVVTAQERRFEESGTITKDPWFTAKMQEVADFIAYDADGLPMDYPYMRFRDNEQYPQAQVLWSRTEDSNIGSGFACDGKSVWYATTTGKVVRASLDNGNPVWSRQLDGKVFATPALGNGILVVPCCDGKIYGLNASDGIIKWHIETAKAIVASPAIFNKKVYVGDSNGFFRCINIKDGSVLWMRNQIVGYCDAAPYVDADQVLFTTWGNRLYSFNPETGATQWRWSAKASSFFAPGACTPIKAFGRVFIIRPNNQILCFNAYNGEQLFMIKEGRSIGTGEDCKIIYVKTKKGQAMAFNSQIPLSDVDGALPDNSGAGVAIPKMLWQVETGIGNDVGTTALTACGNLLLIPSDKGCLHAFDANKGVPLWIHKVGIGVVNPVTAWKSKGKVFILASTMDGSIEFLTIQ